MGDRSTVVEQFRLHQGPRVSGEIDGRRRQSNCLRGDFVSEWQAFSQVGGHEFQFLAIDVAELSGSLEHPESLPV